MDLEKNKYASEEEGYYVSKEEMNRIRRLEYSDNNITFMSYFVLDELKHVAGAFVCQCDARGEKAAALAEEIQKLYGAP